MFLLFIVISLVVMIFIYGNIQQDGLVLSIVATLCCFWLGLLAVSRSVEVCRKS